MKIRLNQVKKQFDKILTRREDREIFAQQMSELSTRNVFEKKAQ